MLTCRTSLFPADVLKKCALIALHVIAEGRDGDGCHVPDLGDEWAALKSPIWESEGEAWSEDAKRVFKSLSTKQCVQRSAACHRVVWAWWQDLSFPAGLGAGKGDLELPHGPGHAVPGNA